LRDVSLDHCQFRRLPTPFTTNLRELHSVAFVEILPAGALWFDRPVMNETVVALVVNNDSPAFAGVEKLNRAGGLVTHANTSVDYFANCDPPVSVINLAG
jgi:hypothetical protein